MRYFYQPGAHALEIIQFYKRQLWAGQFVVEHQQPYRMANNQHMSWEDNSLKSNLNRFWEVEAVEQSTMTAEQQAFEKLLNKMGLNLIDTSFLS